MNWSSNSSSSRVIRVKLHNLSRCLTANTMPFGNCRYMNETDLPCRWPLRFETRQTFYFVLGATYCQTLPSRRKYDVTWICIPCRIVVVAGSSSSFPPLLALLVLYMNMHSKYKHWAGINKTLVSHDFFLRSAGGPIKCLVDIFSMTCWWPKRQ